MVMQLIVLRGGRVLDPSQGLDETADVLIEAGRIRDVGRDAGARYSASEGVRVIDMSGRWVCPGFIDLHVHLREPGQEYKEDIASGAASAGLGLGVSAAGSALGAVSAGFGVGFSSAGFGFGAGSAGFGFSSAGFGVGAASAGAHVPRLPPICGAPIRFWQRPEPRMTLSVRSAPMDCA